MKFKIALAVALVAAGSANAATSTSSFNKPLELTEINQTGTLNLFNSALGTLTGAILTVSDSMQTDITFKNNAAQAQLFRAVTTLDLTLSSSLAALNAIIGTATPGTATDTYPVTTLAAGASVTKPTTIVTGSAGIVNLASILPSLIGPGSFTINCMSFSPTAIFNNGGNVTSTQTTLAQCGASIVYTFTPTVTPPSVPVPASAALLGLGLLAAGAVRRRKA
jgi:hypothetical protein